jgi:hypothetical protein
MPRTIERIFDVTFKENKKYNPAERTVRVEAFNDLHAENIVYWEHGTLKFDLIRGREPGKKITITKVKEIEKEAAEECSKN